MIRDFLHLLKLPRCALTVVVSLSQREREKVHALHVTDFHLKEIQLPCERIDRE